MTPGAMRLREQQGAKAVWTEYRGRLPQPLVALGLGADPTYSHSDSAWYVKQGSRVLRYGLGDDTTTSGGSDTGGTNTTVVSQGTDGSSTSVSTDAPSSTTTSSPSGTSTSVTTTPGSASATSSSSSGSFGPTPWIIGAAIVAGVGVVGYTVFKHRHKIGRHVKRLHAKVKHHAARIKHRSGRKPKRVTTTRVYR